MTPSLRVAVLDTETTGLYAASDHIIEIAVVLLEVEPATGRVLQTLASYDALQDPGHPIPWAAIAVHGITDAMVRGQRIDSERVRQLLTGADLVVAHNSGFDKGFVAQVVPEVMDMCWACSCRGIPWRSLFSHLPNAKLQDLARAFGVPKGTAHRALGDVETTLALLNLPHPDKEMTLLGHLIAKKIRPVCEPITQGARNPLPRRSTL